MTYLYRAAWRLTIVLIPNYQPSRLTSSRLKLLFEAVPSTPRRSGPTPPGPDRVQHPPGRNRHGVALRVREQSSRRTGRRERSNRYWGGEKADPVVAGGAPGAAHDGGPRAWGLRTRGRPGSGIWSRAP